MRREARGQLEPAPRLHPSAEEPVMNAGRKSPSCQPREAAAARLAAAEITRSWRGRLAPGQAIRRDKNEPMADVCSEQTSWRQSRPAIAEATERLTRGAHGPRGTAEDLGSTTGTASCGQWWAPAAGTSHFWTLLWWPLPASAWAERGPARYPPSSGKAVLPRGSGGARLHHPRPRSQPAK